MYSSLQLAKKYIHYYFTASNGKGHGIHSPFVFDFIKNVLNDKKKYSSYQTIEKIRNNLLQDKKVIDVEDFGAGSAVIPINKRIVKDIAASSPKPKKFAQLLFRIVKYYRSQVIVELGTSFGITSAYLAAANKSSQLYTMEGSENIASIAATNFRNLGLQNIKLIKGNFDERFPELLAQLSHIDLAFIDGNHRKVPTLNYFDQLLKKISENSILIFDDIHWSAEMEAAWKQIQQHIAVTLSIDLFFIGIVFFKKDFKVKQHFVIRF